MARVSEALERLQKATTKDIMRFTGLERTKVNQALAGLLKAYYVDKGEFTGKGNENYWIFIKPYSIPKSNNKDWSEHYEIFRQMVLHGRMQKEI